MALSPIANRIRIFNEMLAHNSSERPAIRVPDELIDAWVHLLLGLVNYRSTKANPFAPPSMASSILGHATLLLEKGLDSVVRSLSKTQLMDHAIVPPMGIASLVSLRLLGNASQPLPDITETYSSYLRLVVSDPLLQEHGQTTRHLLTWA